MLTIAQRIARGAARHIAHAFRDLDRVAVYEKSPADYVTSVDLEVERRIIEQLQYSYPQHSILSEERGEVPGDAEWQWIIDPLDGTGNFVHGLPHFAVSIACLRCGEPEHAVVLDVMRDEEFSASRGGGALLDGRRIRVSGQIGLLGALIASGSLDTTRNAEHGDATARGMMLATAQGATLRRSGSAVLDMAYVAAGRCDAMWDIGLQAWDIAAGALLVQEAGGLLSDPQGGAQAMDTGSVLCGSPDCHRLLAKMLGSVYGKATSDL